MNNYVINHKDAAVSSLANLMKRPLSSLLIFVMLGIAVTLPLVLYLGVQSSKNVVGSINATTQLTVFMNIQSNSADVEDLRRLIKADSRIKSDRFIPKSEALINMQESLGGQDLVSILDSNPLPDAFVVTPKSSNPKDIEALKASLETLPLVDQVSVDSRWMDTLYQMQTFLDRILMFLAVTLGLAFVLVSYNTIRLQILAHKEEIEITKLLGATNSYIRRPFLYHAVFQGMISLVIGIIISLLIMRGIYPNVKAIMNSYGIAMQWRFFHFGEILVIFIIVILLGIAGAWWATSQHLREFRKNR